MRGARATQVLLDDVSGKFSRFNTKTVDYAALEARLMAGAASNSELYKALLDEAKTPQERSRRKALMFGNAYGVSMGPPATRCGWCGTAPVGWDYVLYCATHRVDSAKVADALVRARWRQERRVPGTQALLEVLLKEVPNDWIIFE
jgi:hypothetical protein